MVNRMSSYFQIGGHSGTETLNHKDIPIYILSKPREYFLFLEVADLATLSKLNRKNSNINTTLEWTLMIYYFYNQFQ